MDHFGIGSALQATARIYFQSGRRTGRTTSLLQSLKDGDRVIVPNQQEKVRWQQLTRERNLMVEVVIYLPESPYKLRELRSSQGRTLFEHTWVEKFYLLHLEQAAQEIDELQQRLSGSGEAFEKTERQGEEMMRWHS